MNKYDDTDYQIEREESIEYEEKTADEMFEELAYKKEIKSKELVYENENEDKIITFNSDKKNITCNNFYDGYETINMQELQAINKKVKELGWLDE